MPDGAVLIRPVFSGSRPLFESHHNHHIPLFPLSRDGYSSNSSDHITIILHTGYAYELPVAVRPARSGLYYFRNRVLMGSMHTGLEEHPDGAERLAAFYAERARHGVALIVTGGIAPVPPGS